MSRIENLGHTLIKCEKCDNKLIDLGRVESYPRTTKVQVKCENTNCGGSSLLVDMDGEFKIGATDSSKIIEIDMDDEEFVTIHAKSIEWKLNN